MINTYIYFYKTKTQSFQRTSYHSLLHILGSYYDDGYGFTNIKYIINLIYFHTIYVMAIEIAISEIIKNAFNVDFKLYWQLFSERQLLHY